jgi:hypothetical protein
MTLAGFYFRVTMRLMDKGAGIVDAVFAVVLSTVFFSFPKRNSQLVAGDEAANSLILAIESFLRSGPIIHDEEFYAHDAVAATLSAYYVRSEPGKSRIGRRFPICLYIWKDEDADS